MIGDISLQMLNDSKEEGLLLEWLVAVGEHIAAGQVIAIVETEKATIEVEAPASGVIESLQIEPGQVIPPGSLLGTFRRSTESRAGVDLVTAKLPPLVKETAANLDPQFRTAAPGKRLAAGESGKSVTIRRLIARKMQDAWRSIPHFYVTMAIDMTDIIGLRKDLGVTINDFVLTATARALTEHPWVNASWNGEQGVALPHVNISMAVATDRGLFNPVIQHCEKLSLKQISAKARELGEKAAKQGRLKQSEMEGATFTVTNMGMLGVESFGAIITPPQAAVLSVGTVKGEIIVDDQGEPAVAPIMRLTLSADHRVLDGADAAEFLDTIKSYLEAPIVLVSE